MVPRTGTLVGLLVATLASAAQAQVVRIGVLGLFRPTELMVSAVPGAAVVAHVGKQSFVIDNTSACRVATITSGPSGIDFHCGTTSARGDEITVTSREATAAEFFLGVPGKITRRYRGRLEIRSRSGVLIAVVAMDLETAVASIVGAENLPNTPLEALKAQAIASRSYLLAGRGRHHEFDFCDTTHCQYLREPPGQSSPAAIAARATRGLVLAYRDHAFAPMYTRSCSGRTHTPAELGMTHSAYPYFSVECSYCRQHPARWESRIRRQDLIELRSFDENARIIIVRRLGWDTIPSDDFTTRPEGGEVVVEGVGQGHGIGLCEAGARAMADNGADFHQILSHYYPNAAVIPATAEIPASR
jgi:peptidoglycan hydrolase-like amidase